MAGKWRRSCAPSRAPGLSGTRSYEAAHTRLCLLSLWHGKTTSRRHGKRRESREKCGEAETRVAGWEKECWLGDRSGHRDRGRKQKVDTGRGRCWKELVVTGRLKHPAGPPTHDQPRLHPSQVEVRHLLKWSSLRETKTNTNISCFNLFKSVATGPSENKYFKVTPNHPLWNGAQIPPKSSVRT